MLQSHQLSLRRVADRWVLGLQVLKCVLLPSSRSAAVKMPSLSPGVRNVHRQVHPQTGISNKVRFYLLAVPRLLDQALNIWRASRRFRACKSSTRSSATSLSALVRLYSLSLVHSSGGVRGCSLFAP